MKEYPIPFRGPMARAVLEGRKTQTRRVVKPQPTDGIVLCQAAPGWAQPYVDDASAYGPPIACPYGQPGNRLWVREACAIGWHDGGPLAVDYHADGARRHFEPDTDQKAQAAAAYIGDSRRPPFLMPKWASRIWLEVTGVRVERLQEISFNDAKAEGLPYDRTEHYGDYNPLQWFQNLWNEINAKRGYSWESNPWVWVIEFKPVQS